VSISVLTADDEADVADLLRQHFRREVRQALRLAMRLATGIDRS
jgi:hypothetical protein